MIYSLYIELYRDLIYDSRAMEGVKWEIVYRNLVVPLKDKSWQNIH
jgi:hypothetical protein